VHDDEPSALYFPAGHKEQDDEPAVLYCPAGQFMHADDEVAASFGE